MNEELIEKIDKSCKVLHLDFSAVELASLAEEGHYSDETIDAVAAIFAHIGEKKKEATVRTLLRLSRLPLSNPKTFESFDFNLLHGKNVKQIKSLATLSAIYAHKNVALIGPAGTGKTHLAQAFGYACCHKGLKAYFIKMTELRDRFTLARQTGRVSKVLNTLVCLSCLIIDEVGHCTFDKENTRIFFDLVDRRYNKGGYYNMIFTSNKTPSEWRECFNEDDALLCSLDRIFDDAVVYMIKGNSYRGQMLETYTVQANKPKEPISATMPKI